MKIVADSHIPFVDEYFSGCGDLILKPGRAITHADVKEAEMLLVRSVTHVDEKLLANSRVKFVGSVTAGADHLDTKWLGEAGIAWHVAAGFNAPPVADYVISVIAALQKKGLLMSPAASGICSNHHGSRCKPEHRLKAAVIGVGHVGRLVVERLKLLNFDVILCDPLRALHEKDFISVPIEAISDVDLISLHVPLTKRGPYPTHHFMDKDFLSRQKKGCVLLNASRGAIVHANDLMQYGQHLNWCFDVWEHEPAINKAILARALIATPHIAGYSVQSKIRGIAMIYRIAYEENFIPPQVRAPIFMQDQQLEFAGEMHQWNDIVLGIFNPFIITAMMNTIILPAAEHGVLFDEMRRQFNYRYEFAFTQIMGAKLSQQGKMLLTKLGLRI